MKYMNHLRKLALLSSLALSFAVHADGTLPLPMQPTDELPLVMDDARLNLALNIADMRSLTIAQPVVNRVKPCGPTDQFYYAKGTVNWESEELPVLGICKPAASPMKRVVVAIDGATLSQASKFVLLEGTPDNYQSISKFKGTLNAKFFFAPQAGPFGPEAESIPLSFELYRK